MEMPPPIDFNYPNEIPIRNTFLKGMFFSCRNQYTMHNDVITDICDARQRGSGKVTFAVLSVCLSVQGGIRTQGPGPDPRSEPPPHHTNLKEPFGPSIFAKHRVRLPIPGHTVTSTRHVY